MNVIVDFTKDGQDFSKTVYPDENCDAIHLKQLACCEASCSPNFARLYFEGKLLNGTDLITDLGLQNGSHVKLEIVKL